MAENSHMTSMTPDMWREQIEAEILRRLTAAMREADREFEHVGGSTRHHVRDCLMPILGKHGLCIHLRL